MMWPTTKHTHRVVRIVRKANDVALYFDNGNNPYKVQIHPYRIFQMPVDSHCMRSISN